MNYTEMSLSELEELFDKVNERLRDARSIREQKEMEIKLDEIDKMICSKLPVQKYEDFSDKELNNVLDEYEKHHDQLDTESLDHKAMCAVYRNRIMKRIFSEDSLKMQEELDRSILLNKLIDKFYINKITYTALSEKDILVIEDFYNDCKEFGQKEASKKFNIPYKLNEKEKIEEAKSRLKLQGYDVMKTQELNEDILFLERNGYIVK